MRFHPERHSARFNAWFYGSSAAVMLGVAVVAYFVHVRWLTGILGTPAILFAALALRWGNGTDPTRQTSKPT